MFSFSALEHLKPEDFEEIVTTEFAKKLLLETGDTDIFNSPDHYYMASMIDKFPTTIIEVTLIYQFFLPLSFITQFYFVTTSSAPIYFVVRSLELKFWDASITIFWMKANTSPGTIRDLSAGTRCAR